MQSHNALRGVSAEVARFAVVNFQTSNKLTEAQLETQARANAAGAPFELTGSSFGASVVDAATQRVSGAKELTLTVTYNIPLIMPLVNFSLPQISYSRPIFLLNS